MKTTGHIKRIKKNKLIKRISIFIIGIFLFAFVYYICFQFNTSSFIIDSQYNQKINRTNRIQDEYVFYIINDRDNIPFTIDEYNNRIRLVQDSVNLMNKKIDSIMATIMIIDDSIDYYCAILDSCREYEIQEYHKTESQHIKDSIQIQTRIIDSINRIQDLDLELLKYRQIQYLKLCQLEYNRAITNLKNCQYVLDHFSDFGDTKDKNRISELQDAKIQLLIECDSIKQSKSVVFNKLSYLDSTFHKNRKATINYLDFCYYSVMIATSNNFGEILPNNTTTRLLTITELLFLFVEFMMIIDAIMHRKDDSLSPKK